MKKYLLSSPNIELEDNIKKILMIMETMDRLEAKLDAATSKVSEALDVIREKISGINEGRKKDNAELLEVKKIMLKIQNDTSENTTLHREVNNRVTALNKRYNNSQLLYIDT